MKLATWDVYDTVARKHLGTVLAYTVFEASTSAARRWGLPESRLRFTSRT